jgi:hypothetical protein
MNIKPGSAPMLQVSSWLNTDRGISLDDLRGSVIVLHAFQMLCPSCVSHGIPQASAIHNAFPRNEVAVIGLHTVFEHHNAMGKEALEAFVHEYKIKFPIGIDQAATNGRIPLTMQAYRLQGTPSIVIFDRSGQIRLQHFGRIDDLQLGAIIGQLIAERSSEVVNTASELRTNPGCDEKACSPN